jgi:site-specific recombinase XerD
MTQARPSKISESTAVATHAAAYSPIDRIIRKIRQGLLPCKEQFVVYLLHKWRMNLTLSTLKGSVCAVSAFLLFYAGRGKSQLQDIVSEDVEGFVEHEQDRGLKISTVRTRLRHLWAFLQYLIHEDIVTAAVLKKKIRLKVPEVLPRAIAPGDVRKLLGALETTRDRALILVLLRTGMRIGELLNLQVRDLDVRERKIHIYEGEKNCLGRVVYLSDDAVMAVKLWLKTRNPHHEYLFGGRGRGHMSYTQARSIFTQCISKAGLQHKGYTMHSLRHTFASELLNAGMRLECLQLLLGHHDIEMTRRYARLTDKSREEEYFRAMAIIQRGGIHGTY